MQASELDRCIRIERATTERDAFGEMIQTWAELATVRAQATPVRDGERLRYGEVAAQITMRFVIRWSPEVADLDERDRVLFDGRLYDISGVKEIGRRRGLEISAAARGERTT